MSMMHADRRPCRQPALLHPERQQTMQEAHLVSLQQALAALETVTERFEGYEPQSEEDCAAAETTLAFASKALEDHGLFLEDTGPQVAVALLYGTLEVIDEARMYLSAYRPFCQSRKLAHLKRRRLIRWRLEQITCQAREILAAARCPVESAPRPEEAP
jgi:hypothetical protein